tara:strand:+ start:229 stop:660 length:432 start_codon:yes stop_codon:yes gene_type:complete
MSKIKMSSYIGVKLLNASEPMTKSDYCKYRGWGLPVGEDPNEMVRLVEYAPDPLSKPNVEGHDGYVSMSPVHVFDEAYKETNGLTFGLALEAMNKGLKVAVPEWGGYWFKESGMVKVMTAEGELLKTPHFQQYIFRGDWYILD